MDETLFDKWCDVFAESLCNELGEMSDELLLSQYYTEDVGSKVKSVFDRIIASVKKLYDWVIETLQKVFSRKEVVAITPQSEVVQQAPKQIEISKENDEIIKEGKKSLTDLEKCKTIADVDRALIKYHKKKERIRKLKKAAKATVVISLAAAVGWIMYKKNKEVAEWKVAATKAENEVVAVQKKLEEERHAAEQAAQAARNEIETVKGALLGKTKEVEQMKRNQAQAENVGTARGQLETAKAKTVIIKDVVQATVNQTIEITNAITSPNTSAGQKAAAVVNAPAKMAKAAIQTADKGVKGFTAETVKLNEKQQKIKEHIDKAIKILESDSLDMPRREKALEFLIKAEPKSTFLDANYHTRMKNAINMQGKVNKAKINYTANQAKRGKAPLPTKK